MTSPNSRHTATFAPPKFNKAEFHISQRRYTPCTTKEGKNEKSK